MGKRALLALGLLATVGLAGMGQTSVLRGRSYIPSGAVANGTLTSSVTVTCTAANQTETDLWSYTLPAGTLNANGRGVRITVYGTTAATANTKTLKPYFGASSLTTSSFALNAGGWRASWMVLRTGASAEVSQTDVVWAGWAAASGSVATNLVADTTAAISIKITGTNDAAAAAGDICVRAAFVETIF